MKQPSETMYKTLTATERARLVLAAFARGDEAEGLRLRDSCPLETYRFKQWEYVEEVNKLTTLALTIENLGRGVMVELFILRHAAPDAALEQVSVLKGMAEGWKTFCDETGIPNNLYKAVCGEDSLWLTFAARLDADMETPASPSAKAEILAVLWQVESPCE